ncbi:unnamed protein product [Didymodactylos carnosus]|uniref:Amine oxidase n=1 Tax=Didymodactylos carnosus TaxID=1234261 RepID=A0A814C3E5_9BILA|nr:unnamed protein product [Didymodactylos carnosus]CAF1469048.1 unnamed protein product [Didymodactylos carnosus]CAF3713435.1 unnamed protein product [Didymodactylos carnosus]CAF4261199.1 unnamed protein product [Didymodactylos carnosus]
MPVSGGLVASDGLKNSLAEVNCESLPWNRDNPVGNAWTAKESILPTVGQARSTIESRTSTHWKIINPLVRNRVGQPVAYKLVPAGNVCPLYHKNSSQYDRGGFTRYHLWGTVFEPDELYAAGHYPNQQNGQDGLPVYSEKNKDKSLIEADLVTWYTFDTTHIVRPEDWPVMPVESTGFKLLPHGFFDGNPSLDVPASHCHAKKSVTPEFGPDDE